MEPRMNCSGGSRRLTPHLDELARTPPTEARRPPPHYRSATQVIFPPPTIHPSAQS